MFCTVKNSLGSNWPQRTPMRTSCVQGIENISSCEFYVYPVVPNKLGKVMKYEAKKIMSIIYLETSNIEWGQIDPKGKRRVKRVLTLRRIDFQLCRLERPEPTPGHCGYPSPRLCRFPLRGLGLLDGLEHTHSREGSQVHWRTAHSHGQQHARTIRRPCVPPLQAASQYVHLKCSCFYSYCIDWPRPRIDQYVLFLIN